MWWPKTTCDGSAQPPLVPAKAGSQGPDSRPLDPRLCGNERRMRSLPFTLSATIVACTLLVGCFEPLYGERSLTGGPTIRDRLSAVEILPIAAPSGSPTARIAVELRNQLIFETTGGGQPAGRTHQLKILFYSARQPVIVDITTGGRPDVEQYGLTATFTLVEIATNKTVLTGQTFARVSFDNPGYQQRFAQARGFRDAENRAVKVLAENIRSRLASYFVAGA